MNKSNDESKSPSLPDHYKVLEVERFAHINTIKKQYKKLALTLHPDKNPSSEDAFKSLGEAMSVLSDKIRRKEYDMKLRISMQSQASNEETFWTACSTRRLLHQFERKYLGNSLMCPRCKKCFEAIEVEETEVKEGGVVEPTRVSARIKDRVDRGEKVGVLEMLGLGGKRKVRSVGEILEGSSVKVPKNGGKGLRSKRLEEIEDLAENSDEVVEGLGSKKTVGFDESGNEGKSAKEVKDREEETMTLAQMQMFVKQRKVGDKSKARENEGWKEKVKEKEGENEGNTKKSKPKEKERGKEKEKETAIVMEKRYQRRVSKDTSSDFVEKITSKYGDNSKPKEKEGENECNNKKSNPKEKEVENERNNKKSKPNEKEGKKEKEKGTVSVREKRDRRRVSKDTSLDFVKKITSKNSNTMELHSSKKGDLEIMPVEDSDFYDFDKDRKERNFKKGQVWAVYDDDDGMPRHYALINDVSFNPFEVTLSWLDFQSDNCQQIGSHASCGNFRISRKVSVKYLNLFSHLVDSERAAREVYRIYPNKGSIWAINRENNLEKRSYDIVVLLSSYSDDVNGVSIAFLEKVEGFRTVYKRREIGANAVKWLGKEDIKVFSHQIPAKKLSGKEDSSLPKDCWELDPASLFAH